MGRRVGFLGKEWDLHPLTGDFGHVEAIWEKERKPFGNAFLGETLTEQAGSKCVQVKGRVALKSLPARFTPPGKAVRGFSFPPIKWSFKNPGGLEGSQAGCSEK